VDRFPLAKGITVDDLAPRSFTDDQLLAVANPLGVERVVLIQHHTYHGYDNSCCIAAAKKRPDTFRVVGMVDESLDEIPQRMKKLLEDRVTAFRITPRIRPASWLTSAGANSMWHTAARTGQSMCCLIDAEQLDEVDATCKRHPDTAVVIDHFARIGVDGQIRDSDVKKLCGLARHRHTYVKISAFYALGKKRPPHNELRPMVRALFDAFGPERLMWGSDCPYQLNESNNYQSSLTFMNSIDYLSDGDRLWLMKKTAEKVFFFDG
jgi:predicted TIM-barrel fold metal-dependent hydrolase